jgi:hypothetical protein
MIHSIDIDTYIYIYIYIVRHTWFDRVSPTHTHILFYLARQYHFSRYFIYIYIYIYNKKDSKKPLGIDFRGRLSNESNKRWMAFECWIKTTNHTHVGRDLSMRKSSGAQPSFDWTKRWYRMSYRRHPFVQSNEAHVAHRHERTERHRSKHIHFDAPP